MQPAVLYCRTSSDKQEKEKTIQSQIEALIRYAEENNYEIIDRYLDRAWSGSILERPQLDRLRDDAKAKKFNNILILHPDRLSRTQLHQLLLLEEFKKQGIRVIFVELPDFFEQSEESQVVNRSVWSMVSEIERLRIRERCRRGRRFKAEKGLVVGNIPPYGYRYVKKDKEEKKEGYYKINPEEAKVVKMLFDWAKEGLSQRAIVKKLEEKRIFTRGSSGSIDEFSYKWARSTISKILKNETYASCITFYNKHETVEPKETLKKNEYKKNKRSSNRIRPRDEWIPIKLPTSLQIISKEDFDFVQEQIKRNRRFSKRNTKHKYLLRRLVKCKYCGFPYYANGYHGDPVYRCCNRANPKDCERSSISARIMEPLVWQAVKEVIFQPGLILKQAKRYEKDNCVEKKDNKELDRLFAGLKKEEERVLEAYRQGVVDLKQLKSQMENIKLRRENLREQRNVLKPISFKLLSKGIKWLCKEIARTLKKLDFNEKQRLLQLLISEIILGKEEVVIKGILPIYDKSVYNEAKLFDNSINWGIVPTAFF